MSVEIRLFSVPGEFGDLAKIVTSGVLADQRTVKKVHARKRGHDTDITFTAARHITVVNAEALRVLILERGFAALVKYTLQREVRR